MLLFVTRIYVPQGRGSHTNNPPSCLLKRTVHTVTYLSLAGAFDLDAAVKHHQS